MSDILRLSFLGPIGKIRECSDPRDFLRAGDRETDIFVARRLLGEVEHRQALPGRVRGYICISARQQKASTALKCEVGP